jgi:hypothetical protein
LKKCSSLRGESASARIKKSAFIPNRCQAPHLL